MPSSPAPTSSSAAWSTPMPRPVWRLRDSLRFTLVVALAFTLLNFALSAGDPSWTTARGWWRAAGTCFLYALTIRAAIDLLYFLGARLLGARLDRLSKWQRQAYFWSVPLVGISIALPLANVLAAALGLTSQGPQLRTTPLGAAAFMLLILALFYGYFTIRGRQQRAERQAVEAQLKLLQGQIEPHFLFNTLANVVSLMESDTPRAKAMLESFVDYLRSSLGGLRRDRHTLGDEIDLIDAYLRVIAIRMEDRLRYSIEVPEALRAVALPALTLQPLVENAVLHGLEPKIEGGSVRIEAQLVRERDGDRLALSVIDDGLGLAGTAGRPTNGSGTALANIRERLQQAHAGAAALRVEPRQPQGVRATLTLPVHYPPMPSAPAAAVADPPPR